MKKNNITEEIRVGENLHITNRMMADYRRSINRKVQTPKPEEPLLKKARKFIGKNISKVDKYIRSKKFIVDKHLDPTLVTMIEGMVMYKGADLLLQKYNVLENFLNSPMPEQYGIGIATGVSLVALRKVIGRGLAAPIKYAKNRIVKKQAKGKTPNILTYVKTGTLIAMLPFLYHANISSAIDKAQDYFNKDKDTLENVLQTPEPVEIKKTPTIEQTLVPIVTTPKPISLDLLTREIDNNAKKILTTPKHKTKVQKEFSGVSQYEDLIEKAASKYYDVEFETMYAIASTESGGKAKAKSRAGAAGIWQFMPGTGSYKKLTVGAAVDQRYDPIEATKAAAAYMHELTNQFGEEWLAVAAYNGGSGRVARAIKKAGSREWRYVKELLPDETVDYVVKVESRKKLLKEQNKNGFEFEKKTLYTNLLKFSNTHIVEKGQTVTSKVKAANSTYEIAMKLNPDLIHLSVVPENYKLNLMDRDIYNQYFSNNSIK
ncbi:MAG: lytic transglycosylase domain-containing protein [archaeon]